MRYYRARSEIDIKDDHFTTSLFVLKISPVKNVFGSSITRCSSRLESVLRKYLLHLILIYYLLSGEVTSTKYPWVAALSLLLYDYGECDLPSEVHPLRLK